MPRPAKRDEARTTRTIRVDEAVVTKLERLRVKVRLQLLKSGPAPRFSLGDIVEHVVAAYERCEQAER